MRGIVQSKPFVKRNQRATQITSSLYGRRGRNQPSFFSFIVKKWGIFVGIVFLSLFLIIFLLKGTFYNPVFLIQDIEYSQETRSVYENTELYVLASQFLRGKSYNTLRVGGDSKLLNRVKKEYPFVKKVHLNFEGQQKVKVDFEFDEPEFIVKLGEKKYGVRGDGIYTDLNDSRSLGSSGFIVDTPSYLDGVSTLSGFFYEVGYSWYDNYLGMIQDSFPHMTRFVSLVGSPNFIVFEDGKMIYLHKDKVSNQLIKLDRLRKYYDAYDTLSTIDLGSLTQEKVIVGWG